MLSQEQLERFHRQGYLVIENLVDEPALQSVRSEYSDLMDRLYADWQAEGLVKPATKNMTFWDKLEQCYKGGFDWYQPFDISLPHHDIREDTPMHIGPAVFDLVTHNSILDTMESLIGPELTSNPIQHIRIKPPQRALPKSENRAHVMATDWHQDKGVTLEEADDTEFITIWLAISDATIENGCLQVAGGTYDDMLPHCAKTQVGIADPYIPREKATPTPVKAGGAVIFHPLTPHASLANVSDEFRWSLDIRYNVTGQPTGRSQFPEFVARSRSNPNSELRDWKVWQSMWDDTRTRLANSPHMPQHRWDANSPYCA
ncbi:MAG: phytanoyl-CoA dioxygenase [Rhizobiaceae bacterium]|nr:phytanoyl-CoA dioxygenase [Rhizobiaceae bacterium]